MFAIYVVHSPLRCGPLVKPAVKHIAQGLGLAYARVLELHASGVSNCNGELEDKNCEPTRSRPCASASDPTCSAKTKSGHAVFRRRSEFWILKSVHSPVRGSRHCLLQGSHRRLRACTRCTYTGARPSATLDASSSSSSRVCASHAYTQRATRGASRRRSVGEFAGHRSTEQCAISLYRRGRLFYEPRIARLLLRVARIPVRNSACLCAARLNVVRMFSCKRNDSRRRRSWI